ncbi:hypothetical protein [Pseudomonas batumici]|uniref:hypothetical protein n=1 Tax=Pseudomonas batumici TaxID=226910 RepID=UPI001FD851F2|nr:hypothetical protein [Pseudomonas batumici]
MKLTLFWGGSVGDLSPSCRSNVINREGVSPLACLLTDDGGLSLPDTLAWLDEGVDQVRSVKELKTGLAQWDRESWGAELSKSQVKIHSLYDEEYFEIITLDSFERALLAWKAFVQLEPEAGLFLEVEI